MLMSKLMGQSLCLMQVYESKPSAIKAYPQLAKEISDALRSVKPSRSKILLGNSNAHVGNYAGVARSVIADIKSSQVMFAL